MVPKLRKGKRAQLHPLNQLHFGGSIQASKDMRGTILDGAKVQQTGSPTLFCHRRQTPQGLASMAKTLRAFLDLDVISLCVKERIIRKT